MALQHLHLGRRPMLGVEHVRAAQQHGPGRHVLVIGDQQAALAGVHVLERLGGEAPDRAERAGGSPPPRRTHGVGAVLDHRQAEAVDHLAEPVHVGDMATHVREQQHPGPGPFGSRRQVVQVDPVVGGDAHEHRCTAGVHDRAGYRRQGEGVHEDRFVTLDADGHEGGGQRGPATVEGHAVAATHHAGELGLQAGHVGVPGAGLAVPEQPT